MYFHDALYGRISLGVSRELLSMPELQRLREIRLCNINSPYLTGGTSLNRFEHAIGTAYLADQITKSLSDDTEEQYSFWVASLLHDIVTAPFGHSLDYIYEAFHKKRYEHANIWRVILAGKATAASQPIFFGKKSTLPLLFQQHQLEVIKKILEGEHRLSKYIAGDIDIDNIDNVFRFAFHLGIQFSATTPVSLAKSLKFTEKGVLSVAEDTVGYFQEWFEVRRKLYKFLLEDSGEFVSKALLERCLIECVKEDRLSEYNWVLTDSDLVRYIFNEGNATAKRTVQRLMLMDFPIHHEIYHVEDYKKLDEILLKKKVVIIDGAFKDDVFLHFIRDVNKTNRVLSAELDQKKVVIGTPNDRYLIGAFSDDKVALARVIAQFAKESGVRLVRIADYNANEKQISLF